MVNIPKELSSVRRVEGVRQARGVGGLDDGLRRTVVELLEKRTSQRNDPVTSETKEYV
jgi:hypothetical protein